MSATPTTFAVGDRVICNPEETPAKYHNTVWIVEKVLPVNVALRPVGGGRGLRIHPSALLAAPNGDTPPTVTVVPFCPALSPGAAVTIASPRWKGGNGLHVVLADNIDTIKIALLGGDQHRVWPKVPRSWATEVDTKALLAAVGGLRRPA
ncbi:hypothetical protein [Actinoplanes regularis]|uniref:Uncharacterized protein n=1 Tax=Actinoplanes regularis TaxID=52697 RepID=A0A238XK21_9ACTN|nr:hypothetical protein [Actinoplanes regularis]GIE90494.1 hypothetical protein Are01nite_69740 [Actinoplanes regularis]SNR58684.1 hypothetical protein SAMN06264365_103486 [Actinoplanes regularis]